MSGRGRSRLPEREGRKKRSAMSELTDWSGRAALGLPSGVGRSAALRFVPARFVGFVSRIPDGCQPRPRRGQNKLTKETDAANTSSFWLPGTQLSVKMVLLRISRLRSHLRGPAAPPRCSVSLLFHLFHLFFFFIFKSFSYFCATALHKFTQITHIYRRDSSAMEAV